MILRLLISYNWITLFSFEVTLQFGLLISKLFSNYRRTLFLGGAVYGAISFNFYIFTEEIRDEKSKRI